MARTVRSGRLLPRRDPVTRLPILILFPHASCNCRCVMCDIWKTRTTRELNVADITRLTGELKRLKVERICLSGGEPLMHSDLWRLCEPLRGAGIQLTLLTTGLLLEAAAPHVGACCDQVIVSVDGPSSVHDRIRRVPGALDRIRTGIAALRLAAPRVRVTGRCTVQKANVCELRATVRTAHDLGLDGISFLAADVSSGAFGRSGPMSDAAQMRVALAPEELASLHDELQALERDCRDDFASRFIEESPRKLRRRVWQHFAALQGRARFAVHRCNAPWVSSVIESDGTVRPCFFHPPIGNIHEQGSLTAVLNSPPAIAFRRGLDTTRDPICQRCVCSLALRETTAEGSEQPLAAGVGSADAPGA